MLVQNLGKSAIITGLGISLFAFEPALIGTGEVHSLALFSTVAKPSIKLRPKALPQTGDVASGAGLLSSIACLAASLALDLRKKR